MAKLKLWERPDNYVGDEYPDYYVLPFGRTRDSGLLDQSNYHVALKRLGGGSKTVISPEHGHWAVGWVQPILVHKSDEDAVAEARKMIDEFNNYAVLDDEDYSNREWEAARENIKEAAYRHHLTDAELQKVYGWFAANVEMENTDDTGFYPDDAQVEEAVRSLRKRGAGSGRGAGAKRKPAKQGTSVRGVRP